MSHWFEPIAEHLGSAYLRYSFTKGTVQEVDFVVEALGLRRGTASSTSVAVRGGMRTSWLAGASSCTASTSASGSSIWPPRRAAGGDVRTARCSRDCRSTTEFDAAICLCQGAFGLMTVDGENEAVLAGIAAALKPGGMLALSAFSSYFAVKYHEAATFDAATGVSHERTEVRDEQGDAAEVDLWTACYTPRELRLMCERAGLDVVDLFSVEPGAYARTNADDRVT